MRESPEEMMQGSLNWCGFAPDDAAILTVAAQGEVTFHDIGNGRPVRTILLPFLPNMI
jgi:hypothetical protein